MRTATPTRTSGAAPSEQPLAELPLQRRLALRIEAVAGEEFVYAVQANFPAAEVVWLASAGDLEPYGGGVRWRPPQKPGRYLIQAVVDAGPLGVAVDSLTVELG